MTPSSFFYDSIYHLRTHEELILYDRMLHFPPADELLVTEFLAIEYEAERLNYPFRPPAFNGVAAFWAAKTIYTVCRLILYREDKADDLPGLLPAFSGEITPAAILSADLCLRFLPQVLSETRYIDPDDPLIPVAARHLELWHYSGIGYPLETDRLDFRPVQADGCLQQLYTDRVMKRKDLRRSAIPWLHEKIAAVAGIYAPQLWKEFKTDLGI